MKNTLFTALFILNSSITSAQVKITGDPYLQNVTETEFTVVWTANLEPSAPDTYLQEVFFPEILDKDQEMSEY